MKDWLAGVLMAASPCGEYAPDPQVCERVMAEHVHRPVREDVRSSTRSPWTGTHLHGSQSALEGAGEAIDFDAALAQAIQENDARRALRASQRKVPTTSTWSYLQSRWSGAPHVPKAPEVPPVYTMGELLVVTRYTAHRLAELQDAR